MAVFNIVDEKAVRSVYLLSQSYFNFSCWLKQLCNGKQI